MNKDEEFYDIPFFPSYEISKSGVVKDIRTGEIVPYKTLSSGEKVVGLQSITGHQTMMMYIPRLILMTFMPLKENWWYSYSDVIHLDDNVLNYDLENLKWELKEYKPLFQPGINISLTDYVSIPGFYNYEINAIGQHRSRRKRDGGLLSSGYVSDKGYLKVRLINNNGKSRDVRVHQLVALTFLEHPIDIETANLVVNHIDGNKLNNRWDNLEWITQKENMTHASETGLLSNTKGRFCSMQVDTKEITTYPTANHCSRILGIPITTVRRLAEAKEFRPHRGYIFKFESDNRDWPENITELLSAKMIADILVLNCLTENTERFKTITEVKNHIDGDVSAIHRHIARNNNVPYKGYIIRYNEPNIVWPTYTDTEKKRLEAFRQWSANPICATNSITHEFKEYPSVEAFCKEKALTSSAYIRKKMLSGSTLIAGYKIKYV